ncbi:hypothetical protein SC65A3_02284 [Psychrobacter sp. SC65A.3]|uniref:PilX N-terminal domain-containing pilus assembly protein n=1 Tax=Psychrobacter sp. SC65A.3 TaxID=2983299 RepID=UPI0021DB1E01|nr:PilX N-terminal domain-containing pilus assembly protein [Psychrobacter sp. SC65A.3]WAI88802.1 hypothetical protein SC65A3_02284 [Psychrobacter sp. SC65A.3]
MSTTSRYQSFNGSVSAQQGAVLIVVLLFLVLIILVGVIAVKQSTTDLRLATSDQINTLLLQSADNANQNIEQGVNGNSDAEVYTDMLSRTGPFGHFILDANSAEHEYVFCFRPRGRFFDINKTTINTKDGGNIVGSEVGYCNPSTPADYVSDRNASMTQVNISLTESNANNEVFRSYTIGQDSSEISSQAFMFDINSTAILPAYSGKTDAAKDCFKKTSRVATVTKAEDAIGGCMAKESVPSTVLYEVANVENLSLRKNCVDFGKGKGVICTLPTN